MACCYAQMGQKAAALTCLESILESGEGGWGCGGGVLARMAGCGVGWEGGEEQVGDSGCVRREQTLLPVGHGARAR